MALMGGNEGAHQRQAEADAAELAAVLAVGLLERLEDARLVGGGDADAMVAHPDLDLAGLGAAAADLDRPARWRERSEEHTSELQSLMRLLYAVSCLPNK